jgi:hypothetical protein
MNESLCGVASCQDIEKIAIGGPNWWRPTGTSFIRWRITEVVAQASPVCGEGWRDLLERACVRIRAAVQADGGTFHATQVKEKYGTLRFYWDGALSPEADAAVEEAIELAAARSACTCEVCGEQGRLHRSGGWLMTRCPMHANGRAVEIRSELENIHIVERIVGKRRDVTCRRYDRQTDSFVDVDPGSLEIEEE